MELLFKLAKRGDGSTQAGWVGQITSNAFTKREFGQPVIEDLLTSVDLRLLVDSAGVSIPGDGTPTLNPWAATNPRGLGTYQTILSSLRGEPTGYSNHRAGGLVWGSIQTHWDTVGHEDQWTTTTLLEIRTLAQHPWPLSGGSSSGVLNGINSIDRKLGYEVATIGFSALPETMSFGLAPPSLAKRLAAPAVPFVLGEDVRDYTCSPSHTTLVPTDLDGNQLSPGKALFRHLWRGRTVLSERLYFGKRPGEDALVRLRDFLPRQPVHSLRIAFAFVATHFHPYLYSKQVFK